MVGHQAKSLFENLFDVGRTEIGALGAGKLQKILNDLLTSLALFIDNLQRSIVRIGRIGLAHDILGKAHHDTERIIKFVGHGRRDLAQRNQTPGSDELLLQLLRLFTKLLLASPQSIFGCRSFGNIVEGKETPQYPLLRIAQRAGAHQQVKFLAVLSLQLRFEILYLMAQQASGKRKSCGGMRIHLTGQGRSVLESERKSLLESSVEYICPAQIMGGLTGLNNHTGRIAHDQDIDSLLQNGPGEFFEGNHFLVTLLLGQIRSRKAKTPYVIDFHRANGAVHGDKDTVGRRESDLCFNLLMLTRSQ